MFFILFPVRGSDSDGKWETPPNWPSPFSSSPALQVGVDEWGGLCIGFIYNQLCRCLLLPLQSVVKCGGRMQCNATQLGGGIKGGKSLFSSPPYGFCASSMCVDVH